jgi:hypothetical protein
MLAGTTPVPTGLSLWTAIAALLLSAAPPGLLAFPLIAANSARGLAAMLVEDADGSKRGTRDLRELVLKGLYGINALARVARAEDKAKALEKERGHYQRQKEASTRRTLQQAMLDAAVATYGPILSWTAVPRETSRPHHLAADGFNFDVSKGPPKQTGAFPGELPNCLCNFAPPRPGAKVMR